MALTPQEETIVRRAIEAGRARRHDLGLPPKLEEDEVVSRLAMVLAHTDSTSEAA
jgi:hypothetical protein